MRQFGPYLPLGLRIESDSPLSTRGLVFVNSGRVHVKRVKLPKTIWGYTYGVPVVRRIATPVSYV